MPKGLGRQMKSGVNNTDQQFLAFPNDYPFQNTADAWAGLL